MSLIDYEMLLGHLRNPNAHPGVGRIDADGFASWWSGRSLETYKYNRGEQPYVFQTLAKEAARLIGMIRSCQECDGSGLLLDTANAPCTNCDSRGYHTDVWTPLLDRMTLAGIGPEKRGGQVLIEGDPGPVVAEHYVLPTEVCKLCRGGKYHYECPKCEGDGYFIKYRWFPQRICVAAIGSLCLHPGGDTADKCPWCVHEKIAPGPGQPGLRSSPDRGRAWDYPMGNHPAADDDDGWHKLWENALDSIETDDRNCEREIGSWVDKGRDAVRKSTERAPVVFHMGASQ